MYLAILLLGCQFVNAQEFKETNAYIVSMNGETNKQETLATKAVLQRQSETTIALTSFPLEAAQTMNSVKVTELDNPGLNGVKKVLKIDAKYTEYCAYIVSQYILVTNDGDYISLPRIGNTMCNDSTSEIKYIFPNQKFGKANQIVRSEVGISNTTTISEATTQETFSWNDDDFGTSGAISENL